MGNLVPLALAAAFLSTTLAVVVIIFTRPNPARLLAAFLDRRDGDRASWSGSASSR